MTPIERPQHRTARRAGYLTGALIDIVLLVMINVSPGWQAVPVLTNAAADVVVVVNISLAVALVVNLLSLLSPQPLLTQAGEVISTAAGLASVISLLVVFPFHFDDPAVDWETVVRIGLISVVVVVSVALVTQIVKLVFAVAHRLDSRQDFRPWYAGRSR